MFKLLKNKKGQSSAVQYALTFFLVVAVISSMTVYFKRAVQGRIHDATYYMVDTVNSLLNGEQTQSPIRSGYIGEAYVQYEPYYLQTRLQRASVDMQQKDLVESFGSSSGVYQGTGISITNSRALSTQASPRLGSN